MKECEEERTAFLSINVDNTISIGKCCLFQELLKVSQESILNSNDIINTVTCLVRTVGKVNNFSSNSSACNGKKECNFTNFTLDTIKVNVNGCNLRCAMCNSEKKVGIGNFELYFKLLEKIKGYKLKKLILTSSGEPFLLKEQTLNYLKSLTTDDFEEVLIITNGTNLEEDDIKTLSNLNIKVTIIVSNDAITKETYDKIRINGDFNKVFNNTLLLKKYNLLTHVNVVIQPLNVEEIPFIEDFWNKYNIKTHFVMVRGAYEEFRKNIVKNENLKKFFEKNKEKIE